MKQKYLERETGNAVLMLGNQLQEKVVFIKKHISSKTHPIKVLIKKFKQSFAEYNMQLLNKSQGNDQQACEAKLTKVVQILT